MKLSPEQPIGIFDSGIGGLTVVKEIIKILPSENIVYFGDTARVPYGNKSNKTIKEYSLQNTKFLLTHNVKAIVVACNSASSVAIDEITSSVNIPVLGVIIPGAKASVKTTKNKKIAVIGTNATINSGAYQKEIKKLDNKIHITNKACPLFVPIVEEGFSHHPIAKLAIQEYLGPILMDNFDTLVLGCTHYPLLKDAIRAAIGNQINLIDSGIETARELKIILSEKGLLNNSNQKPNYQFFVSDLPNRFKEVGEMFLGRRIDNLIKLEQ